MMAGLDAVKIDRKKQISLTVQLVVTWNGLLAVDSKTECANLMCEC